MCEIYAGQDPKRYALENRSVRIGGYSTRVQLESAFWELIDEIAARQGLSTPRFLSTLHDEALDLNGTIANFSSLLRTSCLIYLRSSHQPAGAMPILHLIAAEAN